MTDIQKCPKCGAGMVLRTARKGPNAGKQFYGCSKYPDCRATVSIIEKKEVNSTENQTKENTNPKIDENILEERKKRYEHYSKNSKEIEGYLDKVKELFSIERIRDYVLEPFRVLFMRTAKTEDNIRGIITQTAVVNAVLAGLPGKMGIGVAVSVALEAFMAFSIAKVEGVEIKEPKDVLKYFGLLSGVIITILVVFKELLHLLFAPIAALFPFLAPMVLPELIVTNFIGVAFWVGFKEVKKKGKFNVPLSAAITLMTETSNLFKYQKDRVIKLLTPVNIKTTFDRLKSYFSGDLVVKPTVVQDDVYASIAMAALMTGSYDELNGPMGKIFIQSIRERFPDLKNASLDQISDHMHQYNPAQMTGVVNEVKGKMFEHMVVDAENKNGDHWVAHLFKNETHPSTDMVLENSDTHEKLAISLKATDSHEIIEKALSRYPSDHIITTSEVQDKYYVNNDMVSSSYISNAHVTEVTKENFDQLLHESKTDSSIHSGAGMGIGSAVALMLSLWPFVIAYYRKKIDIDQLKEACKHILGTYGERLAVKIVELMVFGPIVVWTLLAKTIIQVTDYGEAK
jgi:ssDNA-binding Zn-finger/Zn-ribbon topoisomerase 1